METTRKTPFVKVDLTIPARDELRRAALDFTPLAGRRVPMSDVLLAALKFANEHRDEIAEKLREAA